VKDPSFPDPVPKNVETAGSSLLSVPVFSLLLAPHHSIVRFGCQSLVPGMEPSFQEPWCLRWGTFEPLPIYQECTIVVPEGRMLKDTTSQGTARKLEY